MSSALTARIAQEHEASLAGTSRADANARHRARAMELLGARGLPIGRDENWKYANLRALERARFAPAAPAAAPASIPAGQLPGAIENYRRFVFIDGAFAPALSAAPVAAVDLTVRALGDTPAALRSSEDPDSRFALLNEAFATDGAFVSTADAAEHAACVEFIFVATGSAASYPRLELHAGSRSHLRIIERHVGVGADSHLVNTAVSVELAAGARVDHYRVQQAAAQATWIDTVQARLAAESDYQMYLIHMGAASARSTVHASLNGERATFGMQIAAVADRQQVHDVYASVDHAAPHSLSRQAFRGIAAGRARAACNSKVIVREGARGSDSHQSLRGLLAGADAEIDVRPQLEIYTDDVRCAHGATAGKLDDAMLFYLLSRGIDPEIAQQLLKWAFLEDVVSRIQVPELRKQIEHGVASRMTQTAALAELL